MGLGPGHIPGAGVPPESLHSTTLVCTGQADGPGVAAGVVGVGVGVAHTPQDWFKQYPIPYPPGQLGVSL